MAQLWHLLAIILFVGPLVNGRYIPRIFKRQSPASEGLYQGARFVTSLTTESLPGTIYERPYATYVEFYNTFCGFCQRFAPHWIELSEDIQHWRDVVRMAAVDCSNNDNRAVCRQFEVTNYPSIRYIPPKYEFPSEDEPQMGTRVPTIDHSLMKSLLVQKLINEDNPQSHWPVFNSLNASSASTVFETAPNGTKAAFVFVQDDKSLPNTTVAEVMLDFHSTPGAIFRRTSEHLPLMPSHLSEKPWLFVSTNRSISGNVFETASGDPITKSVIEKKVKEYLRRFNLLTEPDDTTTIAPEPGTTAAPNATDVLEQERLKTIIETVKTMPGTVFRADLDSALRFALFQEVPQRDNIFGDQLIALKQFVSIVVRYFPFANNGYRFMNDLQNFVMNKNESLSGKEFETEAKRLETLYSPVFQAKRWVGCASFSTLRRRYPCSLWTMFHHLTVAANGEVVPGAPLQVLHSMHGYIRHFFGCTECSEHFQEMAADNNLWRVRDQDEAIMWLWAAHNEVNERLRDDISADPDFPKVQFPPPEVCPKCYTMFEGYSAEWNEEEVLYFLKRMHQEDKISQFGLDL